MISTPARDLYSTRVRNEYGCYHLQLGFFNRSFSFLFNSKYERSGDNVKLLPMGTTINQNGAALLYLAAKSILDGEYSNKEVTATVPCNNNTALTLEYAPGENNQSEAYLIIERDNIGTLTFILEPETILVKEDGTKERKVVQAGLEAFATALLGYLTEVNADEHKSKFPEGFDTYLNQSNRTVYTTKNNYQWNNTRGNNYYKENNQDLSYNAMETAKRNFREFGKRDSGMYTSG